MSKNKGTKISIILQNWNFKADLNKVSSAKVYSYTFLQIYRAILVELSEKYRKKAFSHVTYGFCSYQSNAFSNSTTRACGVVGSAFA